jgi:hypothetical protein
MKFFEYFSEIVENQHYIMQVMINGKASQVFLINGDFERMSNKNRKIASPLIIWRPQRFPLNNAVEPFYRYAFVPIFSSAPQPASSAHLSASADLCSPVSAPGWL